MNKKNGGGKKEGRKEHFWEKTFLHIFLEKVVFYLFSGLVERRFYVTTGEKK